MAIQKTDKIWHNGKFIPWDDATIHVMSHVVHYGSSVFEGIRCYALPSGPAIFRATEHMQRLLDSAASTASTWTSLAKNSSAAWSTWSSTTACGPATSAHRSPRIRRSRRQPIQLAHRGLHL